MPVLVTSNSWQLLPVPAQANIAAPTNTSSFLLPQATHSTGAQQSEGEQSATDQKRITCQRAARTAWITTRGDCACASKKSSPNQTHQPHAFNNSKTNIISLNKLATHLPVQAKHACTCCAQTSKNSGHLPEKLLICDWSQVEQSSLHITCLPNKMCMQPLQPHEYVNVHYYAAMANDSSTQTLHSQCSAPA